MLSDNPCKICTSSPSKNHFGVISCRACGAFFRRIVNEKKIYKCKADSQCKITTDVRTSCRKCRLDKCFEMGMKAESLCKGHQTRICVRKSCVFGYVRNTASGLHLRIGQEVKLKKTIGVRGKRDPICPRVIDPNPLCVKSKLEAINSPYSETTIPKAVFPIYKQPTLLTHTLACYRQLCSVRKTTEIVLNPDYYQNMVTEGTFKGFTLSTAESISLFFRSQIPSIVEFLTLSFRQLNLLDDSEKWTLIRPFLISFWCLDNSYKTYKTVPRGLFTQCVILSETTYFDVKHCEEWVASMETCPDVFKIGISGLLKRWMQLDRQKTLRAMADVQIHDEEFIALIGLLFWSTCVENQSANLKRVVAKARSSIFEDLYSYHRLHDLPVSRFGQIVDIDNVVVMEILRCRECFEFYAILDAIKDNDFFYELVKNVS